MAIQGTTIKQLKYRIFVIIAIIFYLEKQLIVGSYFPQTRPPILSRRLHFTNFYLNRRNKTKLRYVFGGTIARAGEFPYIVSLQFVPKDQSDEIRHACGGMIIKSNWILTARHCLDMPEYDIFVKPNYDNTDKVDKKKPLFFAAHRIIHKKAKNLFHNDIGLIKLNQSIPLKKYNLAAIKLSQTFALKDGVDLTVSGWGRNDKQLYSVLLKAHVVYRQPNRCIRIYNDDQNINYKNRDMLCVGGDGKGACNADSGGPLVLKKSNPKHDQLIGIVSWGPEECARVPSVYVNVTNYLNWIRKVTGHNF